VTILEIAKTGFSLNQIRLKPIYSSEYFLSPQNCAAILAANNGLFRK